MTNINGIFVIMDTPTGDAKLPDMVFWARYAAARKTSCWDLVDFIGNPSTKTDGGHKSHDCVDSFRYRVMSTSQLTTTSMCGDHPSFTKTELNAKEAKVDDKEKEKQKEKSTISYTKIAPTQSSTEAVDVRLERALGSSEQLRLHEARRRARDLERDLERERDLRERDLRTRDRNNEQNVTTPSPVTGSRPLAQAFPFAAVGSFRWPPYLLAVWVLVLVLTHVLHCLVSILEKALPALKKCTSYFRTWTEQTWKAEQDLNHKLCPIGLAAITCVLYSIYFVLYALYAVVVWSIEPLCSEVAEESRSSDVEAKVTDYVDIISSKTNSNLK